MATLTASGFGLELSGLDLQRLTPSGAKRLREAFRRSGGLVVVRGQARLDAEGLLRFARLFGPLELNAKYDPDFLLPGHPEILRIGNLKANGRYRSLFVEADPPPLLWHSDDSFRHPQPLGSCLLSIEAPPAGAETGFAGMGAAYDRLDEATKREVEGLVAVHSYPYLNELLRRRNPHRPPLSETRIRTHPPVRRALVAVHPDTRRNVLNVPRCHIASIEGLSPEKSERLLDRLLEHATRPEHVYMHRWERGDVVVWDNRSVLHAPTPFDAARHRRLLYRVTIGGEPLPVL